MDDYPHGDFLLFPDAQRFHHVDVPIKSLADGGVYGVGGDAVRVDADDVVGVCDDGAFGKESALYRHAEIVAKNRILVRVALSMERACVFHNLVGDFVDFPRRRMADIVDYLDGVFFHLAVVLLEYPLYPLGNGKDRSGNDGDIA